MGTPTTPRPLPRRSWLRSRVATGGRGPLALAAATVLAATAVVAAVDAGPPADAAVPPPPSGWTTVWSDDFNGAAGSLPSAANWIIDTGTSYPGGPPNWGTGERQTYTNNPANLSLDGQGNLRITPLRDGAGNWTSGRIETQRANFKPAAGRTLRIESRLQMPNVTGDAALGYWSAFWALGSPYRGNYWNWPGIGEFDVMENVNGINSVWGVLHCGVSPGGPCNENNGIGASRACPGSTCQSAFHTYSFEWDRASTPNAFRWYVDGQQYHSVTQAQLPADTWASMTEHAGYFLLLNVAMGGGFPDGVAGFQTPTPATVPGRPMVVDYVAVFESGGGGNPPTTTTTTNPPGNGFDARSTIQAEAYSAQNGTFVENTTDAGGGQNVAGINNGNWLRFDGVRFGSTAATQFKARVASGAGGGASGLVQVRLGSPTGAVIGDFAVGNTGGWQSWRTIPANIRATTGTHTVYITFSSGQPADFVNVNWVTFGN